MKVKFAQIDRPFILFYNLAQCDGLVPHVDVCNTKKICVKECPGTHWQKDQGKAKGLEEFCEVMDLQQFNTTTMAAWKSKGSAHHMLCQVNHFWADVFLTQICCLNESSKK